MEYWEGGKWYDPPGSKGCYCAKHNQHANARGPGGSPLKNRCSDIDLRAFQSQNIG